VGLTGSQGKRFVCFELELTGQQLPDGKSGFSDAAATVPRGIGEDMVEFVCDDPAESTPVGLFAAFGRHAEELSPDEAADALAIDIGEREDDAATDGGPAEWAGSESMRIEAGP
jgi:hypothetical protein